MATLNRWRDVISYGFAAAIATTAIGPFFQNRISFQWLTRSSITADILKLVSAGLLIVLLHSLVGVRLSHLRQFLRYPPLPTAVIVGLGVWAAITGLSSAGSLRAILFIVSVVAGGYIFLWLGQVVVIRLASKIESWLCENKVTYERESSARLDESAEALAAWLERESPIESVSADAFHHRLIAERLLTKLTKGNTTVALQGAFGSGKTSIERLAQQMARERKVPLIFVEVSCWGFTQSLYAQEELLSQVIRSVNNDVETFCLRTLPSEYANAVEGHGTWYKILAHLISGKRSPQAVLFRLSPILAAIRRTVVLFIEDADRNFATFDMSQLEALLARLRLISGLSFVLCVSPSQKIDLTKLCDRTEIIPPLDESMTMRLIDQTRQMVLTRHPINIMVDGLEDFTSSERGRRTIDHYLGYYWPRQIIFPMLARTPRILKRALRRVVDAWPDLCGEVNLDDLVGISILREGAPEAFAFFQASQRFFRPSSKEERDIIDSAKTKLKESLAEEWQQITASKSFDARSAAWLMKQLDPYSAGITGLMMGSHMVHRQSIQSERRGHIYARRLFTETTEGEEIADQRMFALLKEGQTDDKNLAQLAEVTTESQFASEAFEEFAAALKFDRFLPLLSQIYRVIRERHGPELSRDDHPGFFAPWRMIVHNKPSGFEGWLVDELRLCIPGSLRLLTDIYYFWLGTDEHSFEERKKSRQAIHDTLRNSWETVSPAELASGFDSSFPYTLFHLFFTSDYQKPETTGPLLEVTRVAPAIILPQILWVLNSATNRGREVPRFTLDEVLLEKWFGSRGNHLLKLIEEGFELSPELGAQERYVISDAIEQLKIRGKDSP